MSASLARRIRRIGLLPAVSLASLLDPEQQIKLKDAHARLDSAKERKVAAIARLEELKFSGKGSEVEQTAAKQALGDARSSEYSAQKSLDDLLGYLQNELGHLTRPRLELTQEELATQAQALKDTAKAKRVNARRITAGKSALRVANIKKAFAPKAA